MLNIYLFFDGGRGPSGPSGNPVLENAVAMAALPITPTSRAIHVNHHIDQSIIGLNVLPQENPASDASLFNAAFTDVQATHVNLDPAIKSKLQSTEIEGMPVCPITHELIFDPVAIPFKDNSQQHYIFSSSALQFWIAQRQASGSKITNPLNPNQEITPDMLTEKKNMAACNVINKLVRAAAKNQTNVNQLPANDNMLNSVVTRL